MDYVSMQLLRVLNPGSREEEPCNGMYCQHMLHTTACGLTFLCSQNVAGLFWRDLPHLNQRDLIMRGALIAQTIVKNGHLGHLHPSLSQLSTGSKFTIGDDDN